ncbi:MAG: hypothetical protein H0W20_04890 [Chthoniobacterales bacterium]|nr:hypothetical protein [Chthoniobacterales bacterium]
MIRADESWEEVVLALANVKKHNLCPEPFAKWAKGFNALTTNPQRYVRAAELFVEIAKLEAAVFLPLRNEDPMIYMPRPRVPESEPDARPFAYASIDMAVKVKAWCAPTRAIGLQMVKAEKTKIEEQRAAEQLARLARSAARKAAADAKKNATTLQSGSAAGNKVPTAKHAPVAAGGTSAAEAAEEAADKALAAARDTLAIASDVLTQATTRITVGNDTFAMAKTGLSTAHETLVAADAALAASSKTLKLANEM